MRWPENHPTKKKFFKQYERNMQDKRLRRDHVKSPEYKAGMVERAKSSVSHDAGDVEAAVEGSCLGLGSESYPLAAVLLKEKQSRERQFASLRAMCPLAKLLVGW